MRLLVLAFCFVFSATSTFAQNVQVRSGQHDGFTRLIVDLPKRVEMEIEQGTDEAIISFPGQGFKFDTSRVFRRIARDQILDVVHDEEASTLQIRFGCECEISSFWHETALLVLDIRERTEDIPATPPVPVVEAELLPPPPNNTRLIIPESSNSLAASMAGTQFEVEPAKAAPSQEAKAQAEADTTRVNEEIVSEARDRLIKQIGRAASQGLLEAKSSLIEDPEPHETSEQAAAEPIQTLPEPDPTEHINLKAQSSVDRDFLAAADIVTSSSLGRRCLSDREIDVGGWGTDDTFAKQVGNLRTKLLGEFDQLNQAAAVQLTQLYLFYGLGTEALMTMSLLEETNADHSVMRALATIMEKGQAAHHSALHGQLDCDTSAALWSVLSYQSLPRDLPINSDAVLRTFSALPHHLRSHLGPTLSRRFLEAEKQDIADKILRILDRNEDTFSPDAQLVEAEIDLSEGDQPKAATAMKEVVEASSQPSAEALISLIDATIESGQALSFDHAILAGSYAQQHRGDPLEHELTRVYLAGLSASGAFEQSYEEYGRLAKTLPTDTIGDLDSEMLNQLTQNADDVTFLRYALVDHSAIRQTIIPQVANATAQRLVDLGFASRARMFVDSEAEGEAGRERQLVRARISLAEGRPRQAEAELADLTNTESNMLRAQARDFLGDHTVAATLYSASGENTQSLRQSWFAEDWNRLAETEDRVMADIAALAILSGDQSNDNPDGQSSQREERVLAHNRELIQKSLAARDTIQAILQANPTPEIEQ